MSPETSRAVEHRDDERGSSLVEAVVSLALIAMLMLSIAQAIGFTLLIHDASSDITEATSLAEHKLEELRNRDYANLNPGGTTTADVAGFFDQRDIDGDGTMDFRRRWLITDNGNSRTIEVFVESLTATAGPAKSARMFALVARP